MESVLKSESAEAESGLLIGKTYLKAAKIINIALNHQYTNETLKKELNAFKESKGEEKLNKQMINATRFFGTAIECKKFILKQRVWHEFKKYDKKGFGYILIDQIDRIFVDPVKKVRIVSLDKNTKRVPFDMFYNIWNEYEGIKMVKTFSSKVNFNKK